MSPEGRVKKQVRKLLDEARERTGGRVWYFMPQSAGFGRAGVADFVACVDGRFVAIETKDFKKKPTALQSRAREEVIAAGGLSFMLIGMPDDPFDVNYSMDWPRFIGLIRSVKYHMREAQEAGDNDS